MSDHVIEVERVRGGYNATRVIGFTASCPFYGRTIIEALSAVGPVCCLCGELPVVLIGSYEATREYQRVAHAGMVEPQPYRNLDTRIIPREEQARAERLYRERCGQ